MRIDRRETLLDWTDARGPDSEEVLYQITQHSARTSSSSAAGAALALPDARFALPFPLEGVTSITSQSSSAETEDGGNRGPGQHESRRLDYPHRLPGV
jgi:hypothetical protein